MTDMVSVKVLQEKKKTYRGAILMTLQLKLYLKLQLQLHQT